MAEAVRRLQDVAERPAEGRAGAGAAVGRRRRRGTSGAILRRLADADPAAYTYLADLSPAGDAYAGATLVGASPELLVDRDGERGDVPAVRRVGAALGRSRCRPGQRRRTGRIRQEPCTSTNSSSTSCGTALEPLCADLQIAREPQLHRTAALWHLGTPITGRLRETSTTALDLALALHPTPAVGGVPTAAASELIGELEGDRGFYAGAVGWCDAARRRPLGGVDPLRATVGRPAQRGGTLRRRDRRRIRSR